VPPDLLYVDARTIRGSPWGVPVYVTVEGRNVVVRSNDSPASTKTLYLLDLGDSIADVRDKKIRVRIDGSRIVPYYDRAAINAGALARFKPIAWVDSAADLYSM